MQPRLYQYVSSQILRRIEQSELYVGGSHTPTKHKIDSFIQWFTFRYGIFETYCNHEVVHALGKFREYILPQSITLPDSRKCRLEGIVPAHYICTLRVARAMDPDCKLAKYALQYLRYALDLDIDENAAAHSADGDVLVLEKLFERLYHKLSETKGKEAALKEMMDISSLPSLLKTINFGKHAGKSISEIAEIDRGYLEWLLKSKLETSPDDEDWIYTLKVHLGKLL